MLSIASALHSYFSTRRTTRISDRQALARLQQERLHLFRHRVLKKTRFYQNCWNTPLEDLPIFDKSSYLAEFASLNTAGIEYEEAISASDEVARTQNTSARLGNLTVGFSTGTTGQRGVFLVTGRERMRWLGAILAKTLPSGLFTRNRIALLLAANSGLYQSATELPNLKFRFFDLHEPLEKHIDGLNAFSPTVLVGTAQSINLLADLRQHGRLRIAPDYIVSGGEVLEDAVAMHIEQCFGKAPGQVYQCTEGFFGATCSHGTLHLNEDFQIIEKEWIDRDSRRFVPIITDLSRDTQALVRYRMNDILVESDTPCPCGSALASISRVEGRCDDAFLVPAKNDERLIPIMPEVLRQAISGVGEALNDYKLQQVSPLQLQLFVPTSVCASDVTVVKKRVLDCLSKLNCRRPEIQTTLGIETSVSRKLRRVERTFAVGMRIGPCESY